MPLLRTNAGPPESPAVQTARWVARPIRFLEDCRRRYGDVFTVRFLVFGTGVYVADPAAIKELTTGDQSDLHAGEAMAVAIHVREALIRLAAANADAGQESCAA